MRRSQVAGGQVREDSGQVDLSFESRFHRRRRFSASDPAGADARYALTESIALPAEIVGKKGEAKYAVGTRILFENGGPKEKAWVRRGV